jgi:hypothetical protein
MAVIWSKTRERLQAGEAVLGHFEIVGSDEPLPGSLRWSPDDGALIELVEPRWQRPVNTEGLTLHGLIEDNDPITLLGGIIRTTALDDRVKRIWAYTLALGEHIDPDATWEKAVYASANLPEWRGITGLSHSLPDLSNGSYGYRIDWEPPPAQEVSVKGARLRFGTGVERDVGLVPAYSLRSRQQVVVETRRPLRLEAFSRQYAMPLIALTAFAADRPDSIIEEEYIHGKRQQRIEVWRAGASMEPPEWRPNALLFYAAALPDFRLAIIRWWRLYARVRPALGIFGDYINDGSTFSPSRLITLHTAITGYTDARHGHRDLRKLRSFARVPNEVTGCSNHALGLFGAARDYFAHLGSPGQKFSVEDLEEGTLLATRRAAALMQAALLRELGFTESRAAEILERHYVNWPL